MDLRLVWKVSSFCGRNLKALDAFGNNCQRPVFSLGVSNIMHSITNLVTTLLLHKVVHHKKLKARSKYNIREIYYLFLKNCVTSEGAVSHNVVNFH